MDFFFNVINNNTPTPNLQTYVIPTSKYKVIAVNGTVVTAMKRAEVHMNNYTEVNRFTALWQKGRTHPSSP
jgi:aspartate 1-decarboxylase